MDIVEGKFKFLLLGFIYVLSFGLSFVCYIYVSNVIFLSMNSYVLPCLISMLLNISGGSVARHE